MPAKPTWCAKLNWLVELAGQTLIAICPWCRQLRFTTLPCSSPPSTSSNPTCCLGTCRREASLSGGVVLHGCAPNPPVVCMHLASPLWDAQHVSEWGGTCTSSTLLGSRRLPCEAPSTQGQHQGKTAEPDVQFDGCPSRYALLGFQTRVSVGASRTQHCPYCDVQVQQRGMLLSFPYRRNTRRGLHTTLVCMCRHMTGC